MACAPSRSRRCAWPATSTRSSRPPISALPRQQRPASRRPPMVPPPPRPSIPRCTRSRSRRGARAPSWCALRARDTSRAAPSCSAVFRRSREVAPRSARSGQRRTRAFWIPLRVPDRATALLLQCVRGGACQGQQPRADPRRYPAVESHPLLAPRVPRELAFGDRRLAGLPRVRRNRQKFDETQIAAGFLAQRAHVPGPERLRERHVEPDDRDKGRAHGTPALEAAHGPLAHTRPLRQLPLRQSEELTCATHLPAQSPHPFPPGPLSNTKLHGLLTASLPRGRNVLAVSRAGRGCVKEIDGRSSMGRASFLPFSLTVTACAG